MWRILRKKAPAAPGLGLFEYVFSCYNERTDPPKDSLLPEDVAGALRSIACINLIFKLVPFSAEDDKSMRYSYSIGK
jgi:hypothetical protein